MAFDKKIVFSQKRSKEEPNLFVAFHHHYKEHHTEQFLLPEQSCFSSNHSPPRSSSTSSPPSMTSSSRLAPWLCKTTSQSDHLTKIRRLGPAGNDLRKRKRRTVRRLTHRPPTRILLGRVVAELLRLLPWVSKVAGSIPVCVPCSDVSLLAGQAYFYDWNKSSPYGWSRQHIDMALTWHWQESYTICGGSHGLSENQMPIHAYQARVGSPS